MKNFRLTRGFLVVGTLIGSVIAVDLACGKGRYKEGIFAHVENPSDVVRIFPDSVEEIEARVAAAMHSVERSVQHIIEIKQEDRTFENSAAALDRICAVSNLATMLPALKMLEVLYPDAALRSAAHTAVQTLEAFVVDMITNNEALYLAFKDYAEDNALREQLSFEQRYYLQEKMKEFERAGLKLDQEKRERVSALKKDIAQLSQNFAANIANDNRTIIVLSEGLEGLDADFIDALKRSEDGRFILGVDYPTYFGVMDSCSVEATRKQLWEAFNNRGYPANDEILREIIAKRDELAQLIGYPSYAHLQLSNSMVGAPERAELFLDGVLERVNKKVEKEIERVLSDLPAGVSLTADGKINPWDWAYSVNSYKKKHFSVDENKIAEYFPMEKTVEGLLAIYRQFMSVDFKTIPVSGLWHDDVTFIEVLDAGTGTTLGYLLLDLYPRANKYSHACEETIVPAIFGKDGAISCSVALVVANFPKSTPTKPSLLTRDDAQTFFHEFGHALHTMLGRTHIASFSGTTAPGATPLSLVKLDFVELPSQMLEEWLWDAQILKNLSSHYKTGEQLPDAVVDNILQLKQFIPASGLQGQIFQAKLALAYYAPGALKDPYAIMQELYTTIRPHFKFAPNNHFYAGFGHLTEYGAQYYGYLWSRVFALDVFAQIKEHGLLNPQIGNKYITEVIGKGGSDDPNSLLKNFLGREPNPDAFFVDLGF